MTLLKDIDGVSIGWNSRHTPPKNSGFDDWYKPGVASFNWVSKAQLELVASLFPDIQWHTTWIQEHGAGHYVDHFTETTGFGPYLILIDQLPFVRPTYGTPPREAYWQIAPDHKYLPFEAIPEVLHYACDKANWWKLNAVAALLEADKLPGKVVWADDDINTVKGHVLTVLEHYDALDRFKLISPSDVFTRQDIEESAEWLNS